MLIPVSPLYEIGKYTMGRFKSSQYSFTTLGTEAKVVSNSKRRVVVIVLGETARSDRFSLNGYQANDTTPRLKSRSIVSFRDAYACGTATAISVPCLFSDLGKSGFSVDAALNRSNLLDIAKSVGYEVKWIDNNSGCQGVCDRIEQVDIKQFRTDNLCPTAICYDGVLIEALKNTLLSKKDQLIVLHAMGSHGPSYYLRYPPDFQKFRPSCDSSNFTVCSEQEISNAYDNTIYYTDFLLDEIISHLETISEDTETAMIYISDHGESLGESGIYLHSLPYYIAPKAQKHIPIVFWFSETMKKRNNIQLFLSIDPTRCAVSHDNMFSTVLGILQVVTPEYKKKQDLLATDNDSCE